LATESSAQALSQHFVVEFYVGGFDNSPEWFGSYDVIDPGGIAGLRNFIATSVTVSSRLAAITHFRCNEPDGGNLTTA
jgi:hypothetical protein